MLQSRKTMADIESGNTIEYEIKAYQVKQIIMISTQVRLKEL